VPERDLLELLTAGRSRIARLSRNGLQVWTTLFVGNNPSSFWVQFR